MSLVRGINPIWWIPDLVGNPMDDTFYLFILSNTIPYIPLTVFHDAAGTIPWSNPIEVLANGTMPVDIYWDDNTVYRLEWRAGDTQDFPLTYLVENYVPVGSGGGNVTNSANNTTNQITNPQFSQVNFTGTFTSTASALPDIAPGWDIITTGSGPGSISVTQLQILGDSGDSTNPSFALQIMSTGWDTVGIQQTFEENGALWGSSASDISGVALEISAFNSAGTSPPLTGIITYTGTDAPTPTTIFTVAAINSAPNSYGGAAALPISTNTSLPVSAATAVSFSWTSNNTVVVTSVQLIGQQGTDIAEVAYQQETLERQIDHFYHLAYPIIPVGTVIDFAGFGSLAHYYDCNGAAKNRVTNSLLFNVLTTTETVSLTSTVNTFTVVDSDPYHVGMFIEGVGIPASTTISMISGTTITMSASATLTQASLITFFAWGNGDGSTTFNLPDLRDFVVAGAGGTIFGGTIDSVGLTGGANTVTLAANQIAPHTHPATSSTGVANTVAGALNFPVFGVTSVSTSSEISVTVAANVPSPSLQPVSIVQKTALLRKLIRFE